MRGEGVLRSDNADTQVDLGLTSLSTIKGHFHVTTVKLRFSLPLLIDNLCSLVFFVYCIILVFLFAFYYSCLFILYVFHYALLLWRKIKYLSIYLSIYLSTFLRFKYTTPPPVFIQTICYGDLQPAYVNYLLVTR